MNRVTPPIIRCSDRILTTDVSDDVNDLNVKGRISDGIGLGVMNRGGLKVTTVPVSNESVNGYHGSTNVGVALIILNFI